MNATDRLVTVLLIGVAIGTTALVARALIQHLRTDVTDQGVDVATLPPLRRTPVGSRIQVHRQDQSWFSCSPPPRKHVCWPQSGGWHHTLLDSWYERCPCGAYRLDDGPWMDVNSYRYRPPAPPAVPSW